MRLTAIGTAPIQSKQSPLLVFSRPEAILESSTWTAANAHRILRPSVAHSVPLEVEMMFVISQDSGLTPMLTFSIDLLAFSRPTPTQ